MDADARRHTHTHTHILYLKFHVEEALGLVQYVASTVDSRLVT